MLCVLGVRCVLCVSVRCSCIVFGYVECYVLVLCVMHVM